MKLPPGYEIGVGVKQGNAYGGFGEKMLRQFGWEQGEGLGKTKSGISEAIKVKRKDDQKGVGASRRSEPDGRWWEDAFEGVISKLQPEGPASADESGTSSDEDCLTALERSASPDHKLARRVAAELKQQPAWHGGGRFSGRAGKLERIRRQEAEAAARLAGAVVAAGAPAAAAVITAGLAVQQQAAAGAQQALQDAAAPASDARLGAEAPLPRAQRKRKAATALPDAGGVDLAKGTGGAAPAVEEVEGVSAPRSKRRHKGAAAALPGAAHQTAEQDSGRQQGKHAAAQACVPEAAEAQAAPRRLVITPAIAGAPEHPFQQTPAVGWWGAKRFRSAGRLEGLDDGKRQAAERQEFNESDQEALYLDAHQGKTANKKGLGASQLIGKVAGARWEGSKTTFDDDQVVAEPAAAEGQQPAAAAEAAGEQALPACLRVVKWRRLAAAELARAGKRAIKIKVLQEKLLEGLEAKHGSLDTAQKALLAANMQETLSASSKFAVSSKRVSLIA